ncbi:MAG: homoserine kinase [Zetaproteobacteria bacterium CG12_big_fil_rev_8_21_14_0_65_55_1124]|nr:MAG: homoserine kinase [Zetaproteobacteria bacterium CG1_02_55_237]PIS19642.1 MAG: homoserine kinase [Zetaproteobacteria bacterium CG08_land_8_20_14_0_20_55_17]PIW41984.1 MAG: homoserine kinase [Zetaproteobacteria bacterium CG12_big_fil_rev_8_21_14_0_65_55_1124]PIY53862.1 MAG: homoserine kinase [Zetaproteobacteria bacterium CG_4_10_14_0_8_um_filter_55_43]PIZ37040.1 MAG: homoserine kinase [Zetaproteobacteria bacterium CG_4_10_14_0_2_um_filter_55_20]PJB82951.1 MAG: homoserine kinase [Zetaprot
MSVYTELNDADVAAILSGYGLGSLQSFEGIAAGIENSNFFVNTDQGRYVLTIFERMDADELPYFMHLMHHLSAHGFSCPDVMRRNNGEYLFDVTGKKGAIVSRLSGRTLDALSSKQLQQAGRALAALHLAGASFDERRENSTGFAWLKELAGKMEGDVARVYGADAAHLLHDEISWQAGQDDSALPRGVIHGDLFCDNILFDGDALSGVIDFYYAHDAAYAMDVAISLNALAVRVGMPDAGQESDAERMQCFLAGYQALRPLDDAEHAYLPALLRRAALRFWSSRLFDALYPRGGAMTQTKDPEEYRLKLLFHRSGN